jgi:uncharacterized protein (TIGR02246 family)
MRLTYLFSVLVLATVTSYGQGNKKYDSKDLTALGALPIEFAHYWNIHNMDSMGTMLVADVDFVNVAGTWFKGRSATVYDHKDSHSTMFKSSVLTIDSVALRYVKPDLAIIHIGWGVKGDLDPDGTPRKPRHGIFTWVVIKQNDKWLILDASNVNIRKQVKKSVSG